MRRPPVACRRAVQSLPSPAAQHRWISDDLLTVAVNQSFRTSCPQQKRHGSHVPGPLEARRRAAKRRMTVSAGFYPQENFPQPFSLSALFGFRKESQPTWRYEAPSLQPNAAPLVQGVSPRLNRRHAGALLTTVADEQASRLSKLPPDLVHTPKRTTSTANAHAHGTPPSFSQNVSHTVPSGPKSSIRGITRDDVELAPGSVTGIQHFQQHDGATPDAVDIETYFEIFKANVAGAEDMPGSERSRFLVGAWRSSRPAHAEAWRYDTTVVKHLTDLGWDCTRILSKLKLFAVPPTYSEESIDFFKCLAKSEVRSPHASRVYLRVYMKLAKAAAGAEPSKSVSQDLELTFVVRQSLQIVHSRSANVQQLVADTLSAVASKIQEPNFRRSLHGILAGVKSVEQSVALLLARAAKSHRLCAVVEQVLFCLPQQQVQSLVLSITTSLVKAIEWKSRLSTETYRDRLSAWLTVLQRLDARSEFSTTSTDYLSSAVAEVVEHVFSNCNPGKLRPHILLHVLVFKLAREQPSQASYKDRLLQLIYSSDTASLQQQTPTRLEATLGTILAQIRMALLPYTDLINTTIDQCILHANLHSVYRLLTALDQEGLTLADASNVQDLVEDELALLQQQTAFSTQKQRQHHAFALHACQIILTLLSKSATASVMGVTGSLAATQEEFITLQARRQFQVILDRAKENHALPLVYHNITADASEEQRNILIHQLAHHYSLSTTRTHRETWRAIYYLYNYLQDNGLPIGPLFTKAVVRVSIIRPMVEHRFVSARRLIWVCQLVARVEGEAVAQKIESNYFQWRGDLIKHAKGVHDKAGGDRRAKTLVGTIKRLGMI
jgi:hypothetical protein